MVADRSYQKEGKDLIVRLCIDREDAIPYMEHAHIAIGNMNLPPK